MDMKQTSQKQGTLLILGSIIVGLIYQFLALLIQIPQLAAFDSVIDFVGIFFNAAAMSLLLYFILKTEFFDWFKHFNLKWVLIGIPSLLIVSLLSGTIWSSITGALAPNSINSSLTWGYVLSHVPFMLLGEELLSIGVLYGAWKKLNWRFWQSSLLCAFLFAVWHLPAYQFNLLQCLVTIIPSRLVLNYLFKKTDSIWVTLLVHITFDVLSFLPILLS